MDTESAPAVIAARYEVIRSLGRGSFGRTFLARHVGSGQEVALKLFDLRASADWKAVELFEREAAVLRSLRHQGVPTIYDTFRAEWDGSAAAFLVMEYIAGTSLAQMIEAKQSLGQAEVLNLFLELLGILDYLHTRTLSPANGCPAA